MNQFCGAEIADPGGVGSTDRRCGRPDCSGPVPGRGARGPVAPFQDNWLSVLLMLECRARDVQEESLNVLNFVDVAIMALTGTVYLALCAALWRTNQLWPAIAAVQAFLGIALLIITHTAGRSGLLLGGLIVSAVSCAVASLAGRAPAQGWWPVRCCCLSATSALPLCSLDIIAVSIGSAICCGWVGSSWSAGGSCN